MSDGQHAIICDRESRTLTKYNIFSGERRSLLEFKDPHVWPSRDTDPQDRLILCPNHGGKEYFLVPRDGGEAYVLFPRQNTWELRFDPRERWIAVREWEGDHITLYPWPKGPAPMSFAHDEFLEYLRKQTNVRVIPNPEHPNGFSFSFDPFPGWDAYPY
jgi:hypothetical protein